MTLVVSVLCQGQKNASSDFCFHFVVNLSRQTKFSCPCKNLFVPYIFIYKDVNIFISALSGRSVGSIGNGIVCFLCCITIYCWMVYIFSIFTVWFLNQYHCYFFLLQSQLLWYLIVFPDKYNLLLPFKRYFCHDSQNLDISFSVSHIKTMSWFWLCCFSQSLVNFR